MASAHEDILLLERLKEGDAEAFTAIYNKYRNPLRLLAFHLLKNEPDAKDLVQDLFADFWEKQLYLLIRTDRSRSEATAVKNYLFRAAHNRCLNKISRTKIKTTPFNAEHLQGLVSENGYHPQLQLEIKEKARGDAELWELVGNAISSIPPQSARILALAYDGEARSRTKIAAELNISYQTVKNVLSRTYTRLRDYLNAEEPNGTRNMNRCINGKGPSKGKHVIP
jgi:RNA polymerase sigma-70 factor (ECF subfamily)